MVQAGISTTAGAVMDVGSALVRETEAPWGTGRFKVTLQVMDVPAGTWTLPEASWETPEHARAKVSLGTLITLSVAVALCPASPAVPPTVVCPHPMLTRNRTDKSFILL